MTVTKLNHGPPEVLEAKRLAEIKSLSYVERLERLMVLIEISYMIRTAPKINSKKHESTNS